MFTGIIERTGTITAVRDVPGGRRLSVDAGALAHDMTEGASVAVSGVCLTVAAGSGDQLEFDVIMETLRRSALGERKVGDRVNLERSLRAGDPVDGHFVQGHVDGTAVVDRVDVSAKEHCVWLRAPSELRPCLVPKGSVAVDGVSLTIADVDENRFSVALIPTTLARTSLGDLRVGHRVNVESDVLVRTVVHYLSQRVPPAGLTMDTLRDSGFL